ncbi:glycoside hydrolase family 3 C-terminal domain-containing protein [Oleiharenicola lentus]|uniref:glycoside hydrolase family 3 C-terminal domain-containing protein n=1 Tax=Oleiharenicola lentus TaxID=2508720 RepID=UPI003F669C61
MLRASLLAVFFTTAAFAQPATTLPFRNADLPVPQRVDDLLARLTLEEKIAQTMMATPAIPRLGIAQYDWWNEALHGVARNGLATVFPQAIGLAATWNPELHGKIAEIIAVEARAKNNEALALQGYSKRYQGLTIWSPNINIFRDPRWGRGQETYGEDPFLTGRFGVAFVRGLQGDDPRYLKTVATIKHYAVHSGPEPERHHFDAVTSERDLWETYLPAFEAGIREGGATSVMSAYNAINGIPAPAHPQLLQKILRERWGFTGAVVGDVDNVADLWRPKAHLFSKDAAEASALAIKTGNDLCSGITYQALGNAVKRGLVTEVDIDVALRRLFALRFRLGEFDPVERVAFRAIPPSANATPEHDRVALEAARQSLVLLKNDGTLPWNARDLKTVAVLGPTGFEVSTLLGNYEGTPRKHITLVDGLRAKFEPLGIKVLAEPGVSLVKGFRVSGQPFPAGVLFADAARTQPGLKAEVFANTNYDYRKSPLEGALASTRSDAQVDLQWDEAQPIVGIPIKDATVRWTGVIVPPVSGEYVLGVVAEGAVRLFIDEKSVIDSWRKDPERPLSNIVTFEAGRAYAVRLEYGQTRPKGRIQFGWIAPGTDDSLKKALAAAEAADHLVLTLGITPNLEGEEMSVTAEGFKGGDRLTLDLPATQRELLARVAALKKPTVVVLTTGSALALDDSQANTVLLAWYYGQRGADAVAQTLLGENNPAGRLPVTFYRGTNDLPAFDDYSMRNRTYRYYTGKPLYAFGHGLSYTTFAYEKIAVSSAAVHASDTLNVAITVKNTGPRDGDEVVQLYATAENPPVSMPLRQLVAFQRVPLRAGETKTLTLTVPIERLRRWDETNDRYVVDPGAWHLDAGPASDRLPLRATLKITPQ